MSVTPPDNINYKRFWTYDDPISMLERGATMNVQNPMTIQKYLNIENPSTIANMAAKALDKHSYDNFDKRQIDNTSRETFVYKTDE